MQIAASDSEEELQALMSSPSFDFRFNCGIGDAASTFRLSDKSKIVNAMVLHFTILSTITELEQMKQGLKVLKLDQLMQRYPEIMKQAFQPPLSLECSDIETLYGQECAELANEGTEKRSKQEAILRAFTVYIRGLKGIY